MAEILVSCSYGKEDPERAILSFVFANVAAAADQKTAVLLTIEGVRLATGAMRTTYRKKASSL